MSIYGTLIAHSFPLAVWHSMVTEQICSKRNSLKLQIVEWSIYGFVLRQVSSPTNKRHANCTENGDVERIVSISSFSVNLFALYRRPADGVNCSAMNSICRTT